MSLYFINLIYNRFFVNSRLAFLADAASIFFELQMLITYDYYSLSFD